MRALILLLMVTATSCCSIYTVPEFNTCGDVVKRKKDSNSQLAKRHVVKIDQWTYVELQGDSTWEVGDTVCIKVTVKKFK